MVDSDHTEDKREGEAAESDLPGIPLGPRTRHLLALEFGDLKDFDDPRLSGGGCFPSC